MVRINIRVSSIISFLFFKRLIVTGVAPVLLTLRSRSSSAQQRTRLLWERGYGLFPACPISLPGVNLHWAGEPSAGYFHNVFKRDIPAFGQTPLGGRTPRWLSFTTSPPAGQALPSGNYPLGVRSPSSQITNLYPAAAVPTPEAIQEGEKQRFLAERKNARLEAELQKAHEKLAQFEAKVKRSEEELKQKLKQVEDELKQVEDELKQIEDELKQVKEKNDNLEIEYEFQRRANQTKDEFIQNLQSALDQTDRPHTAENPEFIQALMNELQNVIAVAEDRTNSQTEGQQVLGSAVDLLPPIIMNLRGKAGVLTRYAQRAVSSGEAKAANATALAQQATQEVQQLEYVRDKLARRVKEDSDLNAKVEKACADARRKFGAFMTRLRPDTRDAETEPFNTHSTDLAGTEVIAGVASAEGMPIGEVTVGGTTHGGTAAGREPEREATTMDGSLVYQRKIECESLPKLKKSCDSARRESVVRSFRKPAKLSISPAGSELLRLKNRQTLHCLKP